MSKQPFKDRQNARLILEELEERRLFSGGVEGLLDSGLDAGAIYRDAEDSRSDSSGDAAAAADAEYQTRELVFVDTRVDDYEALVDSLVQSSDRSHQIEVVILERERDGIEQISTALAAYDDLDAVHLISHGSDGSIQLGDTLLDSATLEQNQAGVALWANAFTETGDILIYGCNLAASEAGQSLINELAGLTLADVAASDDLTGHASLGGDWELEHAVGSIESEVAISAETQAQWSAVLAATADDAFEYPVGSLAGNGGGSGWSGAWSGGSSNFQVVNTGLDHPTGGLETSGGAVELNAPGFTFPGMTERDLSSALGAADETIWASFLLQPDEITDPNNSYMGLAFGTGGIANTNQLFVGYSGTNFKLNDWGGGGVNVDVPGVVSGQTYFLVLKLDLSASGNESATLYVNPTAGETTPDVAGSAVKADLDLGTFSTISIAGGRDGATNASLLDQIRIGSNYLDVAPSNPPDITSDGGGPTASLNVDENTTYVTTVTAADPDLDTPTFTITGGDDQAHFDVDLNSGVLSFKNAPNFEAPTDTGTNNSYEVVVTASDGKGGSDSQTITVTVDDVGELTVAVDDAVSVSEDAVHNSASGWFDSNWQYRQTLSFDNSVSTENLTDFPVLIKLDSSKIDYAKTHDQGDDLRFFDQDGAALAHEIELWDESGTSYVWVKVPQIDAASNTDSILMYYGNAAVAGNGQDPAGVWSDFRAAYHLHENPGGAGTVSDSAGNYDATNSGSVDSAGYIGNAQDFNGVDQHIDLGDNRNWINNATASTLSIWMNADSVAGSGDLIGLTRNDPADTGASRITLIQNGDDIQLIARTMDDNSDSVSVVTTSNPLTAGTWHHVTGTVDYASDVNNIKIYVDGVLHGNFSHDFTNNAIPNTDSSHATIGSDEDGVSSFFGGQLDEARIASTLRSADWIAAQYASMTDNFVTLGAEQTAHGVLANDIDFEGDSLTVTQVNGAAGAVGVPTALASGAILTLNADGSFVYDPNGAFEALDVGETAFDSFTYQVGDGFGNFDTATATITVNGAEDAPVIGGTATGTVAEDGTLTASDTLTITDADTSDNPISFNDVAATLGDNGYGNFEITSNTWTYTLNNGHASVQALDVGETLNDTFTFTASDGSTQVVTVTINGAEDAAVIGGTATGSVAEDGTLTATDTLTITDADTSDNPISFNDLAATLGDNGYGNFEITSNTWTYTLNNGHASVQALDVGETLTDTYTFTASDGSTQTVTVTINGAEDAAVIGGTATGSVAEDGTLTATDTLTITDADASDNPVSFNDVAATLGDNGYGNFEITSNTWTYTLNNGHASVQALDVGETLTDTYTFTASDGSTQTVTVTINGAEDAPVIGGTATGTVAEDGTLTASDTLTVTDADTSDNPISFNDVAATLGDNGYGNFEITSNTWTYTLNNGHASVQALDVGETLTDTFTFTASDGSTQVVTVTINGAEDAAVIGGTATGSVAEDGMLTATDTLTITDADTSDNPISFNDVAATLGDNGYGNFEITSNTWTYTLNNGHASVQALDVGETLNDTFTFTASDGSTQVVTVTINGAEDAAVIGGTATGSVAEDGTLTATDTLTITDADTSDNPISFNDVAATLGDNGYGNFEITSNTWTYTLNNGHASVQALDVGETLNDTFTFTASDGSTQVVMVTINGAEDAAVIGGTATGMVAEDGTLTASDTLTITDTDTSDNPISFNDVAATLGDNGYGNFEITSNTWTYTLNNGHAAVQALDVGETLNDTFTFTASDGSTQVVTVTINGAEDAPVIGGTATGTVAEDSTLTATDTLTITDADTSDNPISFNDVAATLGDNGYGNFEITSNTWTYTLNNGHAAVQALDVGETLNDTFTFTASDGSTQVVTVTINGAEDAPVIGGTATGTVAEDGTLTASDTLTITDTDTSDNPISFNDVAATLGDNGYGNFEITSNTWTYTLNNGHASVQALDVGETLNDTFTFTASDGSTQVVTVTINGAEDAAVIGGTATGSVAEDGTLTATDTLTITDADTSDNPINFNDIAPTLGDNGYGNFEITSNTWTYTLNNGHAAVQTLDVGETLTDTYTFTASDGSTQTVSVTINGAEDAPVIGGTATGTVAEDGTLTASDTLTITDADTSDNPISFNDIAPTLGDNGYGNFEITSNAWTYTLNNGHASVQALAAGQTLSDSFTFTASDGSTQVVTVIIDGANDAPIFGGADTGSVTEDSGVVAGNIGTGGSLTIADPDAGESSFQAGTVNGTYGDLTIDAAGNWSYSADNSQAAIQALDIGESVNDTLTVTAFDGTTHNVVITINGAEDSAVIGGTATGAVAEDGTLTATDTLTVTDADTSDNPISFNDVAATLGDNGYGNFEITSNTWTYTLNNGHASVQALDVGETLNDTFTFTASDGSTQVVTVTINGAEDAAVIGGTATGSVAEDGTLTATDTLTITDADTSDNPISFNDVAATLGDNGYGNFEITSNTWTYTLNNGHASVQALDVGETLNDTFTFTASDGSTQVVTVTINGAEDAPVIGGTATGSVAEDGTLTTSDTLTITDADTSDNPISFNDIAPTLGDNGYGNFEITGNTWTYTLNNGHALVQALDVGETLTDTHTFTASDGSTRTVTITIDGAEDMPTLDNPIADQNATEGAAFSFTIPANAFGDVDSSDTLAYSAALAGGGPLPAWLSFDGPTRSFSGTPGAADVGVLDIRITADDGSSTVDDVFTLTIAPFNNLPVIGGVDSGAVTEDRNLVAGQLTESGALTIADPDPGESSFVATTINGALGTLVIDAAGNWAYSANNGQPEIQALNAGESITDTMTVTTADGTTHDIVITIDGVSEAATPPPPQPPAPEPPPEVEEPEEAPEVEAPTSEGATSEPPEIVRMPQETVLPARDEPEAVAPAEAEPAAPPERPAVQPAATVRVAANSPFGLNLAQLKLQVSDDVAVNDQFEHALLEHIERMHAAIDSDSERKLAEDIQVQILLGTSASLTAGIVSWVLRGGSLLASLMSTVPLLNRFDPLPILKSKEEREKVTEKDDATDDTQSPQHERRVDAMFADQEAER